MTFFAKNRITLGISAALAYLSAPLLMNSLEQGTWHWIGTALFLGALFVEYYVMATPHSRILKLALPGAIDLGLDERERLQRGRAYEASYVIIILWFIMLFVPAIVYLNFRGDGPSSSHYFLAIGMACTALMMPFIVLEWIEPSSHLMSDTETD